MKPLVELVYQQVTPDGGTTVAHEVATKEVTQITLFCLKQDIESN